MREGMGVAARGRGISQVHWSSSGGRKRGIPFSNEFTSSAVRARVLGRVREAGWCRAGSWWLELTMWSPCGTCRTTGPLIRRRGVAARVPPARDVSTAPWLLATAAASQSARSAIWKGHPREGSRNSARAKERMQLDLITIICMSRIPSWMASCGASARVGCVGAAQRSRSQN